MIFNVFRYTHISGTDGLPLSVLRIESNEAKPIKGIVQISHGMCEHKERYVDFMKYLASNGYITVIHDHRGHGESVRSPKDRGYMYEGGYKALVEDLHEITVETKKYVSEELGFKDLPFILLGHSMGSLTVRCYIKNYDYELDRLCVLGCPSKMGGLKPGLMLIRLLEAIKGAKSLSKLIDYIVSDSRCKNKFIADGPAGWLSSNPDVCTKYLEDPLCRFRFTLGGYEDLVRLIIWTYSEGGYALKNPGLKIKFFSGKDDPCAISYKNLREAMLLLKRSGYRNVSGKMYKGMRHEILNERENKRVYKDILDFIS
ncbi:MAG: alpha/beta fold hydrolase [Lachnospiraceae bacterium]|nr:alpha/beta fold hydrolase [Lachnospiraceae bacterium]